MESTKPVTWRDVGDVRVINLSLPEQLDLIELDQISAQLFAILDQATPAQKTTRYVLDLSLTDYAGSAVLGLLVNVRQRLKSSGAKLILCGLSQHLRDVFEAGSLGRLFQITSTLPEAIDSF